jgi:hypothetical protein
MMKRALKAGVPVVAVFQEPLEDMKSKEDRLFYGKLNATFDRVPWGVTDRVFLKGQAPPPVAVARVNEALWSRYSVRGLFEGRGSIDPMQAFIPHRYAVSLFAFGQQAEKAGRYDVAMSAYDRSSQLYEIPEAKTGMERCARALGQPTIGTAPPL